MANLVQLKSIPSDIGILSVFEHLLPGNIERVYFINNVPSHAIRGGHRHKSTWQGLVCLNGTCKVYVQNQESSKTYSLDQPNECLILAPTDWHQMYDFSENATLLVIANKNYDQNDYIDEPYFKDEVVLAIEKIIHPF